MTPHPIPPDFDSRQRIAALNDALRLTLAGGRVLLTPAVVELSDKQRARLLTAVRGYSSFTSNNDPHQEHDFGSVDMEAQRFFWKIDYYNGDCTAGSDDPSNPAATTRVLTIMRADEY